MWSAISGLPQKGQMTERWIVIREWCQGVCSSWWHLVPPQGIESLAAHLWFKVLAWISHDTKMEQLWHHYSNPQTEESPSILGKIWTHTWTPNRKISRWSNWWMGGTQWQDKQTRQSLFLPLPAASDSLARHQWSVEVKGVKILSDLKKQFELAIKDLHPETEREWVTPKMKHRIMLVPAKYTVAEINFTDITNIWEFLHYVASWSVPWNVSLLVVH